MRRLTIAAASIALVLATLFVGRLIAPALAQTVFTLYTSLSGSEIIRDQVNPTGGYFTSKLLATTGLAAVKTTVSALPTCNTAAKGDVYVVTDATAPTYGGTLTGGSTVVALALCTGSAWTAQ
jgi:hypothetical protein